MALGTERIIAINSMTITEEQYELLDKMIMSAIDRTVHSPVLKQIIIDTVHQATEPAIKTHVNGKINHLTEIVSEHILKEDAFKDRMEPMVVKYEEEQITYKNLGEKGERVVFWGKVLGGITAVLFVVREILKP